MLWPPWYSTTNNIANFDPSVYSTSNQAVINPANGQIVSGPRYNGIVLPGNGFPSSASNLAVYNDPAVKALFNGAPRGFAETHKNVFEPRIGMSYAVNEKTIVRASAGVFHNRVTLNDSLLLGGNPPFQPQVSVSSGNIDNPGGAGGAAVLPFGMTAIDKVFKAPTAYTYSAGIQRELPWNFIVDAAYVGRRGLYLQRERNINQLPAGTIQANPGVNTDALRPYKGYGVIRLSENAGYSKYNSFQLGIDRRYSKGFSFGLAYTLGKSEDNASDKRTVMFNSYDDSGYWGTSNFDRRHVLNFHYIYDLPFLKDQNTLLSRIARRMADFRVHLHALRHAAVGDERRLTLPVSAMHSPSRTTRSAIRSQANRTVLTGRCQRHGTRPELLVQSHRLRRGPPPARSATGRGTTSTTRASISGTSRCSRMSASRDRGRSSCAQRCSTS